MSDQLIRQLAERGHTVATAESLTGGLVVAALTDVPGSSEVVLGGVCAYSIPIKESLLAISSSTIDTQGVVSEAVACEMARSATRLFAATWGIGTTGVAGPSSHGGLPAGHVWIAIAGPDIVRSQLLQLSGERRDVRRRTVDACLKLLSSAIRE